MQLPEKIRANLNRIDRQPRIVKDARLTIGQFLSAVVRYHDAIGGVPRLNVAVERGMPIEILNVSGMSPGPKALGTFLLPQIEDYLV